MSHATTHDAISSAQSSDLPSIALMLIGDELLRGDVQDENTVFFARWLFAHGAKLTETRMLADDYVAIKKHILDLQQTHTYIFTSGGVGPTHDDITIEAIARTFETDTIYSEEVQAAMHQHYGDRLNDARLRMSRIPKGAKVIMGAFRWVPIIEFNKIYILPGVPWLFRACVERLSHLFPGQAPAYAQFKLLVAEGEIAERLQRIQADHPKVAMGSYPKFTQPPSITLSLTSKDTDAIKQASKVIQAEFAQWLVPSQA